MCQPNIMVLSKDQAYPVKLLNETFLIMGDGK